jgi:asparagine synthase (glutamine-hydrolysing)
VEAAFRPAELLKSGDAPAGSWLALGHRRLAIVDLSPLGHQPMSFGGRYWIVYNGEVYNYLELRAELEAAGRLFVSHCDTEVILAAYAEWGVECLSRFNGMWALAIYDAEKETLLLARDRFGIKPLYHWVNEGTLAFASEIKAFTCLPGWRARVNGQVVHDFLLSSLQDHSRETMFAGVFQLEPGTYATLDCRQWRQAGGAENGALKFHRWYEFKPRPFAGTFEEAAVEFRDLLTDSVRLRLRADVPVGSCLSGGLDSSSIVCLANRLLKEQQGQCVQKTFSACSHIKKYDERDFIEKVVAATGVESHYTFPELKDLFAMLDRLIWHQDEPFATTSIYAQWCVFEAAAGEKVKVMLDGQGADELLYGYANFQRAFLGGLVRSGNWGVAWGESRARRDNFKGAASGFLRALTDAALPMSLQARFRESRRNRNPPEWLSPAALGASYPGPLAGRFQRHVTARELSMEMLGGAHVQMLLHWEDRNSMAHSIESRVPFLDYRLAEFILGLPDWHKIRRGVPKAVLRKGMESLVPEAVLQRRDKMGFVTPEEVWARKTASRQFREALAEAVDAGRGVLTPKAAGSFEDMRRSGG